MLTFAYQVNDLRLHSQLRTRSSLPAALRSELAYTAMRLVTALHASTARSARLLFFATPPEDSNVDGSYDNFSGLTVFETI